MRYFVVLAVISCLLALSNALTYVSIQNLDQYEVVYHATDNRCQTVSSRFSGRHNWVATKGKMTYYFSDSSCKTQVYVDPYANGNFAGVPSPIKSFRTEVLYTAMQQTTRQYTDGFSDRENAFENKYIRDQEMKKIQALRDQLEKAKKQVDELEAKIGEHHREATSKDQKK
ncbi:hypothetical protein GGI13_001217 [Coemansia sp. RSA 455]|nr:hypothetical protein GGI13_001217 [Coemansia sp. RSA 455]